MGCFWPCCSPPQVQCVFNNTTGNTVNEQFSSLPGSWTSQGLTWSVSTGGVLAGKSTAANDDGHFTRSDAPGAGVTRVVQRGQFQFGGGFPPYQVWDQAGLIVGSTGAPVGSINSPSTNEVVFMRKIDAVSSKARLWFHGSWEEIFSSPIGDFYISIRELTGRPTEWCFWVNGTNLFRRTSTSLTIPGTIYHGVRMGLLGSSTRIAPVVDHYRFDFLAST